MSLCDCNYTPQLFQNMFPDSKISQKFSMSKDKASYVFRDGLRPLLGEKICQAVQKSEGAFTVMFDETTMALVKKQMDLLLTYWDEDAEEVVTKDLDSLFFGRATAVDIVNMFCKIHDDDEFHDLPWEKLFSISSDGLNINKAIWQEFNAKLKALGYKGLINLITCTLHVIHNAFRSGMEMDGLGQMIYQLSYDLHAWFKVKSYHVIFTRGMKIISVILKQDFEFAVELLKTHFEIPFRFIC